MPPGPAGPPIVLAAIELAFDPLVRFDDRAVRLETVAVAAVILAVIVVTGLLAGRTPAGPVAATPGLAAEVDPRAPLFPTDDRLPYAGIRGRPPATGRAGGAGRGEQSGAAAAVGADTREARLRRDDLLFIVLGVIPGAIVGGRIGYALLHLDYYGPRPELLLDPGQGSLSLSLAVLGGVLTGIYVTALLEAPVGRWLTVAVRPMLLGLGLGKAAMLLGGSGQGEPTDSDYAVAFLGPGPWGSLAPAIPAHPSQLYEALGSAGVLLFVSLAWFLPGFRGQWDGRLFWLGLGLWAAVRGIVVSTWRDPVVLAGFRAEQIVCAALAAVSLAVLLGLARAGRRPRGGASPAGATGAAGVADTTSGR